MRNIIIFILTISNCFFTTLKSQEKVTLTSSNPPIEDSIEHIDKEMIAKKGIHNNTALWINAIDLDIEGMGWKDGIENYTRLPDKYSSVVSPKVWKLSRDAAGVSVQFSVQGTSFINAHWILRGISYMPHMTPQAVSGLDLYIKQNGKWVWAGVGKPSQNEIQQESLLKGGLEATKTYECMVYLPLYNGISFLEMGFSPKATIKATTPNTKKPFVFYGTSILQGCSASRTGMVFSSMLGRRFETPVINLGFSGNGLMEEYFGEILGEIVASVYFIDCLPNMSRFSTQEITDRTLALVHKLRSIQPTTPIVLVEDRTPAYDNFKNIPTNNNRRVGMKAAYDILINETADLYYVEGNQLLGEDSEATVDGSHPSDLGMYRYFVALEPVIGGIICHNYDHLSFKKK